MTEKDFERWELATKLCGREGMPQPKEPASPWLWTAIVSAVIFAVIVLL